MRTWKVYVPSRRVTVAFTIAGTLVGLASVGSIIVGFGSSRSGFLIRFGTVMAGFAGLLLTRVLLERGYEGDHSERFGGVEPAGPTTHGIDTLD